jgi:hypothetical protein
MKRTLMPTVEPLEGKALLSAGLRLAQAPAAPPMVEPANQGLKVVLATDHEIYHQGQPVVMTLTATNTTSHTISVALGPSTDGFYVTQNGREVWASNAGPQPLFLMLKTIPAGQSFTLSATWNGRSNLAAPSSPTGVLVVHSQFAGAAPVTIHVPG